MCLPSILLYANDHNQTFTGLCMVMKIMVLNAF